MIKYVSPMSFDFDRQVAQRVKVSSRGLRGNDLAAFIKRAGHEFLPDLDRMRPGEVPIHWLAIGSTEKYGCFVAGSRVRMGDGDIKDIEDVSLGDLVVDRRGLPAPVTTLYQKPYKGPGVRLGVSGLLHDTTCTANHGFWVIPKEQVACLVDPAKHCKPDTCQKNAICRERNCSRTSVRYDPQWAEAGQLRPGDYVLCPIPDRGVGKQTWTWSIPFARLLGYFLAEGSYLKKNGEDSKTRHGLSICFNRNEEQTLGKDLVAQVEAMQAEYPGLYVRGPYPSEEDSTVTYHVISASFARKVYRAVGEYSRHKFLSGEVYTQPPDRIANLLATYIDGDATCPRYKRTKCKGVEARYSATTASERLAIDVQWLASKLGVATTVNTYTVEDPDTGESRRHYRASFSNDAGQFLKGLAVKYRDEPPLQAKQWSFAWNGYICRPVREVTHLDLDCEVYNLEVDGDHTYTIDTMAVKNCNRNGDSFLEQDCRDYHHTFAKHGHYFRDHCNKPHDLRYGRIVKSAYCEPMHRVELLIGLFETEEAAKRAGDLGRVADREMEKLARGLDLPGSMACRVAHDVCSFCGNQARTTAEYCDTHAVKYAGREVPPCSGFGCAHGLTKIARDGRMQFVDNPRPCFFDFSGVYRNADRIALSMGVLEKAAGAFQARVVGGAEMALRLGITAPTSLLLEGTLPERARVQLKLAVDMAGHEREHAKFAAYDGGLVSPPVASFPDVDAPAVYRALADAGVVLGVSDWLALAGGKEARSAASDVAGRLPGVFSRLVADDGLGEQLAANPYMPSGRPAPTATRAWAAKLASGHGAGRDGIARRAEMAALRGEPSPRPRGLDESHPDGGAEKLAREYAKYQLAFLAGSPAGESPSTLACLARKNALA